MKRFLLLIIAFVAGEVLYAQNFEGVWETTDSKNVPLSHIQVYKSNGKLYGKVVKLLQPNYEQTCSKCPSPDKNAPMIGLIVLRGLEQNGSKWEADNGVLDPVRGGIFDVEVYMPDNNTMKVKGSYAFISETQTWKRVK